MLNVSSFCNKSVCHSLFRKYVEFHLLNPKYFPNRRCIKVHCCLMTKFLTPKSPTIAIKNALKASSLQKNNMISNLQYYVIKLTPNCTVNISFGHKLVVRWNWKYIFKYKTKRFI